MRLILLALLLALPAHADRVVRADPITVCETSYAEPVARMAPGGVVYDIPKPVCRIQIATKAKSYYLVAGAMVDSQQAIPEQTECEYGRGRVEIGGLVYGRFVGGGILWARCMP